jgi:inosine-uridine nucleoside N-ribohydrolase
MGGTYKGWGNMNLTGEFNLWSDPESSRIVFEEMPKIYLLPWEVADDFIVTEED